MRCCRWWRGGAGDCAAGGEAAEAAADEGGASRASQLLGPPRHSRHGAVHRVSRGVTQSLTAPFPYLFLADDASTLNKPPDTIAQ